MINADNSGSFSELLSVVSRYLKLLVEDTRLNVAQKLTRLLSAIALASLLTIVSTVAMVFVSIAVGIALSDALTPLWSFVIVAGFYVVLLSLLVIFRKQLLVNPIARFLSVLLLDPPQNADNHAQSAPVSNE